MFADNYLLKNKRVSLIKSPPLADCGIIVVIPCFREPDILLTLDSLNQCELPVQNVEIIVLINHSEVATPEIKDYNFRTKNEVEEWISKHKNSKLNFYVLGPVELQKKWAGVGLARKSGMDEALARFNFLKKPEGIIVSLDADTLVAQNYLVEIEKHFKQNLDDVGVTISFEHQTDGLNKNELEGILLYEKYLVYYKNALEFVGYPYAMFTVGSAFAVTAESYVKRGGMTRRQAGEDFYFLQNLALIGRVGELTSTKVYPSARVSHRVPFGTGPIMGKWQNGEEDLTLTYNFQAFAELKLFFDRIDKFFKTDENGFYEIIRNLPDSVRKFIHTDNFWKEIEDLNQNCSTLKSFQTRFYHKFNAFKILKYLNFTHESFYEKASLNVQYQLLNKLNE
jgi:hypothetical protein